MAGLQYGGRWAFDGYNWAEGQIDDHGQDAHSLGRWRDAMKLTHAEIQFLTALLREHNQNGCRGPAHDLLRQQA